MPHNSPRTPPYNLTAIAQDEEIVWWDKPEPIGFALGLHPWMMVATMALIATVAAMVYEWGSAGKEPAVVTFAALFLVVGLWIIIAAVLKRYRHAGRTVYAATPTRIIILSPQLRFGAFIHPFPPGDSWYSQRGWRGLSHVHTTAAHMTPEGAFYRFCDVIPFFTCKPGFYFLEDSARAIDMIAARAPAEESETAE